MEPERDELLRAFADLKRQLDINIELASRPDFIPELPQWRDRSPFIFREGNVDLYHFDPCSQALSKIERGFVLDLEDARTMIVRGLVEPSRLLELYGAIKPNLYRYPAIDPPAFEFRLRELLGLQRKAD